MNQRFYNLSLKEILNNLSLTLIKIINETSIYMEKSDRTTKELIDIFTKDDRMIYVGILLIILSLGIFFIILVLNLYIKSLSYKYHIYI